MPRKRRKNPLPQRLFQNEEAKDMSKSYPEVFPDPALNLPEDPQQRLEILKQTPIISLYRENEMSLVINNYTVNDSGKFCCLKCGKQYAGFSGVKYHLTMACPKQDIFKFTCLICGKHYQLVEEMTEHIMNIHTPSTIGISTRVQQPMGVDISEMFSEEETGRKGKKDTDVEDYHEPDDLSTEEDDLPIDLTIKKESSKKPSKSSTPKSGIKQVRGTVSFAKVDEPMVEAMAWVYEHLSNLESNVSVMYPKLMPKCEDFKTLLSKEEWCFFASQLSHSPPFRIERENLKSSKGAKLLTDCPGLEAFTSLPADDVPERSDLTFCAAGPVWALSWCPRSLSRPGSHQYLAVSTHNDLHAVTSCYSDPGLIEIWDCDVLGLHGHNDKTPAFVLGYSHYDGPIWDLKWCPFGGLLAAEQKKDPQNLSRIGLLAMACASGKVLLVPVPDPEILNQQESTIKSHSKPSVFRMKPGMILLPVSSPENTNKHSVLSECGQCLCISWNVADGCQWIAAGFSSGMVALWKLFEPSSLLLSQDVDTEPQTLVACRTFRAHHKAVRGIAWCPFDQNILATGGHDRFLRLWNCNDTKCPVKESNWKGSIYNELHWPTIRSGVYAASDEVFAGPSYHGALYHDLLHKQLQPTAVIPFKSACWSVSASDWMNSAVGCDAMGEMVVHVSSNLNRVIQCKKLLTRIKIFETEVEWIADMQKKEKVKDEQNGEATKPSSDSEYRLIFRDTNLTDLSNYEKRKCCKNVKLFENFPATSCKKPLVQSVNRVAWNPNFGSHTWIASGTQSGLVRLHCVDAMHFDDMDRFFNEHSNYR